MTMDEVRLRALIDACSEKEARTFSDAFRTQGRASDGQDAETWHLLADVFSFTERFDAPAAPFGALCWTTSLVPADLTTSQQTILRAALAATDDPEAVARLADTLWLAARDASLARRAVDAYLSSARRLESLTNWPPSSGRYTRALRLARQVEPKGPLWHRIADTLVARLRAHGGDDPSWFTQELARLLYEFQRGDPAELADFVERTAARAGVSRDRHRQREALALAAKLWTRAGEPDRAEAARVEAARSYHTQAEEREAQGDVLVAHSFWDDAVRAFRERLSLRPELPLVMRRLAEAGRRSVEAMTGAHSKVDLEDTPHRVDAAFAGLPLDEALLRLLGLPIMKVAELRNGAVLALEQSNSVLDLMPLQMIDHEGRTVGRRPGAVDPLHPEYEKTLRADIQRSAALRREFRLHAQIGPALRRLTAEHEVDGETLTRFSGDTRFVPADRVPLVMRALAAGFADDFTVAVHLLIPQIEAGLRHLAEAKGVVPRTLKSDGTEEFWMMERLLTDETVERTLTPDLAFELRSLLIDDFGPQFCHGLAHGLDPPATFEGSDAVTAWWLGLRLVAVPTAAFRAFSERITMTVEAERARARRLRQRRRRASSTARCAALKARWRRGSRRSPRGRRDQQPRSRSARRRPRRL